MAQKVQVLLVDDLDGGEADETVTFALDGKTYEIDLTTANADKLRGLLEPYVKGGRRTGGRSAGGRGKARAAVPAAARTPRRSAPGRRRTVTRSTTAAVSPRPFARPTRRPTAERSGTPQAGSGGSASPPFPPAVRDRGRPHRPLRPTAPSGPEVPARRRTSGLGGPQPRRRPPAGPALPPARASGPGGGDPPARADHGEVEGAAPPHSSQSSSPGSSSALPAATSRRIRLPVQGHRGPGVRAAAARHVPPRPAAPGRRSAAPSAAEGPLRARRGRPSRARSRTTAAPGRPRRAADGAGARWARWETMPGATAGNGLVGYAALSGRVRRVSRMGACGGVGRRKGVRP